MTALRWTFLAGVVLASSLCAGVCLAPHGPGDPALGVDEAVAQGGFAVYFTDRADTPGAIYQLNPASGAVNAVYTHSAPPVQ